MHSPLSYTPRACALLLVTTLAAFTMGCSLGSKGPKGTPEDIARHNSALEKENLALRAELRERKLDLALSQAMNEVLREELVATGQDLEQVERQFVSMERGLIRDETKASAVATIAEVRLLLDNLKSQTPPPLNAETTADVEAKLAMANTLTRKRNYAAAVYYADRARRILNAGERRHEARGQHLIVTVSRANVRKGPGSSFDVVTILEYGAVILCLDKAEEWCRVRTDKGDEGWIHTTLLR